MPAVPSIQQWPSGRVGVDDEKTGVGIVRPGSAALKAVTRAIRSRHRRNGHLLDQLGGRPGSAGDAARRPGERSGVVGLVDPESENTNPAVTLRAGPGPRSS